MEHSFGYIIAICFIIIQFFIGWIFLHKILIRILNREAIDLFARDQQILARWIAVKAIIGEHSEQETYMTPSHDRMLLRLEGKIPDYFAIYIGLHSDKSHGCAN